MEIYNRSKPTEYRWLMLLCAAVGTILLVFVSSDARSISAQTPAVELVHRLGRVLSAILLLAIVPSLWARIAHTVSAWALAGLAALTFGGGMLIGGGAKAALYTTLLIALPGAGLYLLQRLHLSNFRTVLYGSFVILVALFCRVCLPGMIETGDGYGWFRDALGLLQKTAESHEAMLQEIAGLRITDMIEVYRDYAEAVCVPMLLTAAMAASFSNTLLSHVWNRNGGAALTKLPPFEDWRCERGYVIFSAVFAIVMLFLSMLGWKTADALASVGETLWRMPCLLAGLCAVRRLGRRVGRGWIIWIAVGMLLILPYIAGIVLPMLGMMSSLRKPMNTGENGGQL